MGIVAVSVASSSSNQFLYVIFTTAHHFNFNVLMRFGECIVYFRPLNALREY